MIGAIVDAAPISVEPTASYPVHNLNTTEQFSSIQAAIDAPNTTAGHVIEVDPGNYTENIAVNKSVTIRSATGDPSGTVIQAANTSDTVVAIMADQVTISGFTILNATAAGKAGIYLASSHNRITNNILTSNYYGLTAVDASGGTTANRAMSGLSECSLPNHSVDRSTAPEVQRMEPRTSTWAPRSCSLNSLASLQNWRDGRSGHNLITDNRATFNDYMGMALSGSSENILRNNHFASNGDTGLYLESGSNNNEISNNTADYNSYGIFLYDACANNSITHNQLCANLYEGISLGWSNNNVVTNNTASYIHYDAGISLWGDSSNNDITHNNLVSNSGSGITLWHYNDNNNITHNDASYNGYAGIELYWFSSYNTIKNNIANSNSGIGGVGIILFDYAHNNTIGYNVLNDNKNHGIQLAGVTYNNLISDNYADSNDGCGLALFDSSSDNLITYNELSGNDYGLSIIALDGNPSNNHVKNNTMCSNNVQGVWLLEVRQNNDIYNNTISNNSIFGIGISESSNISITENEIDGNYMGIGLLNSDTIQITENVANANKISGMYLWNSSNTTICKNSARSNTFDGIYMAKSSLNSISENTITASYFGILLESATNNTIADNDADENYYYEVFLHSSPDNCINDSWNVQQELMYGVSVSIPEPLPGSWQAVEPGINATYTVVIENIGNMPDTYELRDTSTDAPDVLVLEPATITLEPGAMDYETITLTIGATQPGMYRVAVEARSVSDTTVKDSVETRTIVRGTVGPEPDDTNTITDSAIINCSEDGLTSSISGSVIDRSAITTSTITDSTITNSVITDSRVTDTILPPEVALTNAVVTAGIISDGAITIQGVTYTVDADQRLDDLLIGSDYRDSDLLGLTDAKTLYVTAADSAVDFDINAKDDYSAGSLRVQRATLPPVGVHELPNSIGGYLWANVSENVANSTEWVIIKVYYDPAALGALDENSLTLHYYNERSGAWEELPVDGRNSDEHYVWANSSHYSVFSVSGSVTPKRSSGGSGASSLDSDGDGLSDLHELIMGTDRDNNDTDGDGYDDGMDPFPLDPTRPLQPTPTVMATPAPPPAVTPTSPTLPPPRASPPPAAPVEEEQGLEFPIPGYEAIGALTCCLIMAYIVRRRRPGAGAE